jgi:hypothetical protein
VFFFGFWGGLAVGFCVQIATHLQMRRELHGRFPSLPSLHFPYLPPFMQEDFVTFGLPYL